MAQEVAYYYWRPFNGTIPEDAFVAFQHQNGQQVYIGNAPHSTSLAVGELYSNVDSILISAHPTENGSVIRTNEFIKIFCTGHPELFGWVKLSSKNVNFLPGLVEGGYEVGKVLATRSPLYVGRVNLNNSLVLGKIVAYYSGINAARNHLYVWDATKEMTFDNFEALAYIGD